MDPAKYLEAQSTEQLLRSLKFHENDRGTMTMDEECRRMYLVQEIRRILDERGDRSCTR